MAATSGVTADHPAAVSPPSKAAEVRRRNPSDLPAPKSIRPPVQPHKAGGPRTSRACTRPFLSRPRRPMKIVSPSVEFTTPASHQLPLGYADRLFRRDVAGPLGLSNNDVAPDERRGRFNEFPRAGDGLLVVAPGLGSLGRLDSIAIAAPCLPEESARFPHQAGWPQLPRLPFHPPMRPRVPCAPLTAGRAS